MPSGIHCCRVLNPLTSSTDTALHVEYNNELEEMIACLFTQEIPIDVVFL